MTLREKLQKDGSVSDLFYTFDLPASVDFEYRRWFNEASPTSFFECADKLIEIIYANTTKVERLLIFGIDD